MYPTLRLLAVVALLCAPNVRAQTVDQLTPHKVKIESVEYSGKRAVKVIEDGAVPNGQAYAVVKGATFHNGEILAEVAGKPAAGVGGGARGFIGIGFRLKDDKFEYIYLRPTNRFGGITRRNTVRFRISTLPRVASSRRRSTRATSISSPACGRASASRSKTARRAYTCTDRRSLC
jgi:hypothetical protein